jgi:chromosome segregation ATPase
MDEQMKAMREQYQDIIDRLKSKMHAPPEQSRSAKKVQMDRAAEKLDDLLCKVEECEEEMARMREEHQQEVDDVVHKYGTTLKAKAEELRAMTERGEQMQAQVQQLQGELERTNKKNAGSEGVVVSDDRVRSLERELDASRAQVKKLERSKKELIDNYEKLLRDAGDDDDDGDDEDDSDGNEEEEEEESSDVEEAPSPTPKKDTRRLTRRQIQQSEVALPPSKAKAKQTTRSSTRRPLGSVSSNVKRSESSLSDDSFGPSQWLFPKTKTKKDPETGTFLRPRGRAPIGVDTWDGSKGAWRLSVA